MSILFALLLSPNKIAIFLPAAWVFDNAKNIDYNNNYYCMNF